MDHPQAEVLLFHSAWLSVWSASTCPRGYFTCHFSGLPFNIKALPQPSGDSCMPAGPVQRLIELLDERLSLDLPSEKS